MVRVHRSSPQTVRPLGPVATTDVDRRTAAPPAPLGPRYLPKPTKPGLDSWLATVSGQRLAERVLDAPGYRRLSGPNQARVRSLQQAAPRDARLVRELRDLLRNSAFMMLAPEVQACLLDHIAGRVDCRRDRRELFRAPDRLTATDDTATQLAVLDAVAESVDDRTFNRAFARASKSTAMLDPSYRAEAMGVLARFEDLPGKRLAIVELMAASAPLASWAETDPIFAMTTVSTTTAHDVSLKVEPYWSRTQTGADLVIEFELANTGSWRDLGVRLGTDDADMSWLPYATTLERWDDRTDAWVAVGGHQLPLLPSGAQHRLRAKVGVPKEVRTAEAELELVVWDQRAPDEALLSSATMPIQLGGNVNLPPAPTRSEIPKASRAGLALSMEPGSYEREGPARFELVLDADPARFGPNSNLRARVATAGNLDVQLSAEAVRLDEDGRAVLEVTANGPIGPHAFSVVVWDDDAGDEVYVSTDPVRFAIR